MLWNHGEVVGAVISWGPALPPSPPAKSWSRLLTDVKDLLLGDLSRHGTDRPLSDLETMVSKHICESPVCDGPGGHLCGLVRKMMLPRSLYHLVETLELNCDLLADGLHRHRSLINWCSQLTEKQGLKAMP